MKDIISLCQSWIDKKLITSKQITINDDNFNVYIKNDKGIGIEFGVYIGSLKNDEENEFLTLMNNLITYNVESNLPF